MQPQNTPDTSAGMDKVPELQAQLAEAEAVFKTLLAQDRKNHDGPAWRENEQKCAAIHVELQRLTGDWYGRPKVKVNRPSDEELGATYETPQDVPAHIRSWVSSHQQLLTSDATDAVRWSRIVGTAGDERYPEGDLVIYRAVAEGDEIRPGDWVTTSLTYAKEHLRRYLGEEGEILAKTVDGVDVLCSPTGNHEEAIYAPMKFSGDIE